MLNNWYLARESILSFCKLVYNKILLIDVRESRGSRFQFLNFKHSSIMVAIPNVAKTNANLCVSLTTWRFDNSKGLFSSMSWIETSWLGAKAVSTKMNTKIRMWTTFQIQLRGQPFFSKLSFCWERLASRFWISPVAPLDLSPVPSSYISVIRSRKLTTLACMVATLV